jgi:type IV pilus assembly protein PilM
MKSNGLFYQEKSLFGFDLGHGSIKVVQLNYSDKKTHLQGYGRVLFDPKAIKEGEIIDFDAVSKAAHELISTHLTGSVNTRSIAASLPVLHSFSRIINLPLMEDKDVYEAVHTEASQYIPIPITDLYLDYQLVEKKADSQDFLVAAAPKRVVDSYIKLFGVLGLELMCLEPSILSVTRVVRHAESSDAPTLVIDCGSLTTDLIIFSKSVVRVTGTIKFGGEALTESIMRDLNMSYEEASRTKNLYGLEPGEHQSKILSAITENLNFLSGEIKKIIRYFEDRDKDQNAKVGQIIILGGGANLPGFSTYLTSELRIAARLASVWQHIDMDHLQKPEKQDASMYATAVGLALVKPHEVVK